MLTGKELKIQRIIKDIKAFEIASYLGIHKSYMSLMETGKKNIPHHQYEKWTEYLGIKSCEGEME